MLIKCLPVGHLMTNCYIVTDETTLECAVIDPGDESNTILYYLEDNHLTCRAILLTHGHYDHTGAVYAVHEETGAPVYMNALDAGTAVAFDSYTFTPPEGTIFYKEGDEVKVGNLTFRVMETPGHTPGGVTLIWRRRALHRRHALRRFVRPHGFRRRQHGGRAAVAGQDRGSARRLRGLPRPHGLLHARDRAPLQPLPDRAAKPRTVKLHKGNRQKHASAGFLPVSGKCARAPLQSGGRRGILFSLEKHLSAIRGQFSSKQSEGTS